MVLHNVGSITYAGIAASGRDVAALAHAARSSLSTTRTDVTTARIPLVQLGIQYLLNINTILE